MKRLLLTIIFALAARGQLPIDSDLAAEIGRIKAVDHHAHPVTAARGNDPQDLEYDALPVENLEAASDPVRMRPDNPDLLDAWRELWGYRYTDRSPEHVREMQHHKKQLLDEKGDGYPAWVLDQAGIETMFANRVALGRGIQPPRFRWVAFADALMYPADNSKLSAQTPDRKAFFSYEDRLLRRYLRESGVDAPPDTLDGYVRKVVTPTLERHRQGGAVAEKFEAAYLRSLDFGDTERAEAAKIYAAAQKSVPNNSDSKKLQDFLFRYIAAECGRLGMAVHIHVEAGAGSYFSIAGIHPLLLESVLNDPRLRKTNFVMVHGGWPFNEEAAALLEKPNAYLDFSSQTLIHYPRDLAGSIRMWLEHVPEKVMFGTDAYPYIPEMGWEEAAWVASRTGRHALALALSGMMRDGEISRERAIELARMVLRENAIRLYHLK